MSKKYRNHRHLFLFKVPDPLRQGKVKVIKSWARVIAAARPVALLLTAEDVKRSIDMDGVGNTQTCSMAICSLRQAHAFPHAVEGYIDWQYSRAYVVTKLNKDGLPCECVVYRHEDDIAKINDSKGGQKKLLADLAEHGDRRILLGPMQRRFTSPDRTKVPDKKPIKRGPSKVLHLRGANLRYAVASLGGIEQK